MRSMSTNYFFFEPVVGFLEVFFLATGFLAMALAATFLAAFFLAASREAVASAFFFAATLAVVDPLEGIGIGPFLETGR